MTVSIVSVGPNGEFTLLLRYFTQSTAGTVLSEAKILDHVWRYDFGGDVKTFVGFLRVVPAPQDRTREKASFTHCGAFGSVPA